MGEIPKTTRDRLLVDAGHRCTICAAPCYEIHHIIEQKDGGGHDDENLIVLCPNCHQQRVHRNKELSPSQLRAYKQGLRDRNEIERRLCLNVEAIVAKIETKDADEAARELAIVASDAVAAVSPDRSPRVHRTVVEATQWLAEREIMRGGARKALEAKWEIERARRVRLVNPPVAIESVDPDSTKKAPDFERACYLTFRFNRGTGYIWQETFEREYKASFYMMKRKMEVCDRHVTLVVGETDNLQDHADFLKQVVQRTNAAVTVRVNKDVDREKAEALARFDSIQTVKCRARTIRL